MILSLCNQAAPTLIIELQSRWVAKVLSGKVALPSEEEMASSVEELYQHMKESGFPKHHTHQLQQNKVLRSHIQSFFFRLRHFLLTLFLLAQFDYENWLITQLGLPPLEEWREEMYFYALKKITSHDNDEYRDTWDIIGGCKDTTAY